MLIQQVFQFIIGICAGIYGYLIPGYLNLMILNLGLLKQKNKLWQTLLMVSMIEFPYCFICMSGMQWLMQQHIILITIRWALVILLLVLSILSIRDAQKKHDPIKIDEKNVDSGKFKRIILLTIFNPFQLTAWAIWGSYFLEKPWFSWSIGSIIIFSFGACIGVFMILWLYAFMGQKLVSYFSLKRKHIDYSVGMIFMILALIQLYRNIQN